MSEPGGPVADDAFRQLVETVSAGIAVLQDDRIAYANPAAAALLGRADSALTGVDPATLLCEEDGRRPADALRALVPGHLDEHRDEYRIPLPDGGVRHLAVVSRLGRWQGRPAMLSVLRDIGRSERRLQELNAKLIRAESFTRGIADNLPVRVSYWDSEQRCRFANRVYCDWFGKSLEQVLGKTTVEIFGKAHSPERQAFFDQALAGAPQKFESAETGADGRQGIWEVQYIPDAQRGEVRGFFVLANDVSVSRHAQAALQALNEQLVAARDVAEDAAKAKAAFLANVSHEIRTPMNVIIGLTHLMQRDAHDPVTADRLAKVGDAAMHLLDIVNDVLDLSKIDAGKLVLEPADFPVDALLSRATALVTDDARRKGLALTVERGDLPPTLHGDALRLSQILVNLLSNAVKFTERGSVALRCEVLARAGTDWTIRFSVSDTGMGISPEARERLFSPFEQADGSTTRRFGGTGLGLSIARELVQLMGGAIGVESEPGRGSRFWFTVRLQPAAPTPHRAVEAGRDVEEALRQGHRGARVLIADDNVVNQQLAGELLRLVGLQVAVADDGRKAVDMARRGGYDLILMDMQMPEMDGLEATRLIRTLPEFDATPIVAMTASAFGADRDACLAAGMNDHLGKPVNPAALYEKMLLWLDASRKVRRAAPPDPPALPARQPQPQGADALQDIAALDFARGMSLFAGQRALYLRALGCFADLYRGGLADVDRFVAGAAGATREAAGRAVHSMGGAAAALGAVELERSARRIDAIVRSGGPATPMDDAALRAELEVLRGDLADLVARLRRALGPT